MAYEWDEAKREANRRKHGVDFADAALFEWRTAVVEESSRADEPRYLAIGYIGERLHAVVYTKRGENRRIISMRAASDREEDRYASVETGTH